jgi:SlyX protein
MSTERVERLEERLAWIERHVTAQDKAMLELHEELARLNREVAQLRARSEQGTAGPGESLPTGDRPPHY